MQKFTCGVKADAIVPAGCVLEAVFSVAVLAYLFRIHLGFLAALVC